MIRDICKDETFLAQKAEPATPEDLPAAADLLETLTHHSAGCVGMAANMIGVNKRIIAFDNEGSYLVMSKGPAPMRRRRGACPSPAPGGPGGGGPSRSAGRTSVSRSGVRPSPAGPPRSSSTNWTTARASSFKRSVMS